ncbi:MAG: M4 family metallopeptidase [Myxococcales bacterium]|nr:M4 family metallopeptidase [Myxococcales bacterium]
MSLSVLLAILACKDPAPATPQDDVPEMPDEAAQIALQVLRDQSEAPVHLQVRHGMVAHLTAAGPIGDDDVVEEGLHFLEDFAAVYGLADPRSQLHPESVSHQGDDTHLSYVQRSAPEQGGLPVFNSGITVHIAQGQIAMTTGRYVPDLVAQAPTLTAEQALDGLQLPDSPTEITLQGEPQLGLVAAWSEAEAPPVHTVWRMTLVGRNATGPFQWRVDVDARSGALVTLEELAPTCDKDFDIMWGDHDSSISCWVFVDTEDWFDADGALSSYDPGLDHDNSGIAAFNTGHLVYDYFEQTFGQCSYDSDDAEMEVVVHTTVPGGASASGYCGTMQFTDGTVALDIYAHEFTHLVDYNHRDLAYQGLSGALDESFADVFASFVEGDWTIGESSSLGQLRDLSNPPANGHPDHMLASMSGDNMGLRSTAGDTRATDYGNVHTNSGIPNKAAYLITAGGQHNGYTIAGLGQARTEQLYHSVLLHSLNTNSTFVDARNALVGTAQTWGRHGTHGFRDDDWCDVANAFASVGVATALGDSDCDGTIDSDETDVDGDGTPNEVDNCPNTANLYQFDKDGDGIGNACDPDLDGDGVLNPDDNCLYAANADQRDDDGDGIGNACDDSDQDGVLDTDDNCPDDPNWDQSDVDGDGHGDVCDADADNDGVPNNQDNCPLVVNPDQLDGDGDGVGEVCDNCPAVPNPDQEDCDKNGVGAACDNSVLEVMDCNTVPDAEAQVFVHPLQEVSLPHVAVEALRLPDDYRLSLTVVGAPGWIVRDQLGNVVARSQALVAGRLEQAVWTPSLDYHYEEAGGRAPFATRYHLQVGPRTDADTQVDFTLQGVQGAP